MFAAALSEKGGSRSSRDRAKQQQQQQQQQANSRGAYAPSRQQQKDMEQAEDDEDEEEKDQAAQRERDEATRERVPDNERLLQQLPAPPAASSSSSSSSPPQLQRFSLELEDEASEGADESQDETKAGEEHKGRKRKGKVSTTPLPAINFLIEQRFSPEYRDKWKESNPVRLGQHWDRLIEELKTRFNEDKTKEQIYNFLHNLHKRFTQRQKREAEIGADAMPHWPYHELMERYLKGSVNVMRPARRPPRNVKKKSDSERKSTEESKSETERKSDAAPAAAAPASSSSSAPSSSSSTASGVRQRLPVAQLFLNHLEAERRASWTRSEVTQRLMFKALTQTQPRSYAEVMAEIRAEMALAPDAAGSGSGAQQAG